MIHFLVVTFAFLYGSVYADELQCFSTGIPQICPAFGSRMVPPIFSSSGISSQAQFDVAFREHLNSFDTNMRFQEMLGASSGFDMGQLGIRYHRSFSCVNMLSSPLVTPCGNSSLSPLCRSDCEIFWRSFLPMAEDKTMCDQPEECRHRILERVESCQLPPFNGEEGKCIPADANEQATCGFSGMQATKICSFCNTHQDSCCELALIENLCINKQTSLNSPMFIVSLVLMILALVLTSGTVLALGYFRTQPNDQKTKDISALFSYAKSINHTRNTSFASMLSSPRASLSRVGPIHLKHPQPVWGSILGKLEEGKVDKRCKVLYSYLPVLEDEIVLEIGHMCVVMQQFDDGWCIGRNLNTGALGAFPLACLSNVLSDYMSRPSSPPLSRPISPRADSHAALSPRTVSRRTSSLKRNPSFSFHRSLSDSSNAPGFYPKSLPSSPP
ncbi:hypothetical protein DSO57_1023139 [Entomophthora muscae]|uniref:Uncharacterized protein n=1 Tax=Entomophthora muscae TaxID=34485 RepID=A0ACC2RHN9_9FUNG|nr:hypothetical protein DSO57_1023139 [Entomophthora muscae]